MESLNPLKDSFEYLLTRLESEGERYLAQKIRDACSVIGDVQQGIVTQEDGIRLLKETHKSMYWAHGGLANFHVWCESADKSIQLNQEIAKHVDFIWRALS